MPSAPHTAATDRQSCNTFCRFETATNNPCCSKNRKPKSKTHTRCDQFTCRARHKKRDSFRCLSCLRHYYCSDYCRRSDAFNHLESCEYQKEINLCGYKLCPASAPAKYATKLCAHCEDERYCSITCQRADRSQHQFWCRV